MSTTLPDLITPEQLGERWGKSIQTLAQMRYLGTGPKFVRVSAKTIRYRVIDIEEYERANTFQRTDDPPG